MPHQETGKPNNVKSAVLLQPSPKKAQRDSIHLTRFSNADSPATNKPMQLKIKKIFPGYWSDKIISVLNLYPLRIESCILR